MFPHFQLQSSATTPIVDTLITAASNREDHNMLQNHSHHGGVCDSEAVGRASSIPPKAWEPITEQDELTDYTQTPNCRRGRAVAVTRGEA